MISSVKHNSPFSILISAVWEIRKLFFIPTENKLNNFQVKAGGWINNKMRAVVSKSHGAQGESRERRRWFDIDVLAQVECDPFINALLQIKNEIYFSWNKFATRLKWIYNKKISVTRRVGFGGQKGARVSIGFDVYLPSTKEKNSGWQGMEKGSLPRLGYYADWFQVETQVTFLPRNPYIESVTRLLGDDFSTNLREHKMNREIKIWLDLPAFSSNFSFSRWNRIFGLFLCVINRREGRYLRR